MSIVQFALPLALSMPFILAAWIAFVHRQRAVLGLGVTAAASAELSPGDPVDARIAATEVDLEAVLREAVALLESPARSLWVRIELALGTMVPMTVPVNPGVLRTALRDTMLTAINAAPGGQLLITTATLGSRLHIRVTDDGPGTDEQDRASSLRRTEASIVLQGGSVAVEARQGRGTSVTIRLPMPVSREREAGVSVPLPVLAAHDA